MKAIPFYQRSPQYKRGKNLIKIGSIDEFHEVLYADTRHDKEEIKDGIFESFHQVTGTYNQSIFTAYKSVTYPQVLFATWQDFPYYPSIELGGDLILQEVKNHETKYLLVDNTFVKSGWMNEKIEEYLDRVWYPSLLELGLKGFGHIQSQSALGIKSFEEFGKDIATYLEAMADKMDRRSFKYLPIFSEESGKERQASIRKLALEEGLNKLLALE